MYLSFIYLSENLADYGVDVQFNYYNYKLIWTKRIGIL